MGGHHWSSYIHLAYGILLFLVGVPGNSTIIYYFSTKKKKTQHSRRSQIYNFFVIFIAAVDLVVCVFRPLSKSLFLNHTVAQNAVLVNVLKIIPFIGSDVSLWGLCGLSLDRHQTITKPLSKRLGKCVISSICILPFFISTFVYFPYQLVITEDDNINIAKLTVSFLAMELLPILTIIILYVKTSNFLKQQSEFVRKNTQKHNEHNHNINAMKTLKALTISMVITVAIPRFLLIVENGIGFFGKVTIGEDLYEGIECFVYNLLFTNNAINIFIYLKFVTPFRHFVVGTVYCRRTMNDASYPMTTRSTFV